MILFSRRFCLEEIKFNRINRPPGCLTGRGRNIPGAGESPNLLSYAPSELSYAKSRFSAI